MTERGITPSQTVGPFFSFGLTPGEDDHLPCLTASDFADPGVPGERIRVEGRIVDGAGAPVPDAFLEIRQADADGHYPGREVLNGIPNARFRGFGRTATLADGMFSFTTIKPGRVGAPDGGLQAPHLNVALFSRGLMRHLFTRIYFSDEEQANAGDPVLLLVPEDRRGTLVARRTERHGQAMYLFDITLQGGDEETVFFEA